MKKKTLARILAILSGFAGIAILISIFYSFFSYRLISREKFTNLLDPGVKKPEEQNEVFDYTKASNWFAGSDKTKFSESKVAYYNLSIPSLKIENAIVAIGGEDLSKHLIQYPGTALPGKRGNAVIFGHSTLPSFFDPTDYITIFSTLPKVEKGNEILVYYDGIEYKYLVENYFEVNPSDIEIFEQNISDSFLTLVTCTPPGDPRKPKRLIVRARLAPI